MGKDARLANIYIKIHNKYALTLEDLKYLSKYDPECFEKACKNIVYKIPETKTLLQPKASQSWQAKEERRGKAQDLEGKKTQDLEGKKPKPQPQPKQNNPAG